MKRVAIFLAGALLLLASARCKRIEPAASPALRSTLRMGLAQVGVATLVQNVAVEGLATVGDNGRVEPWLARELTVSADGKLITVALRPDASFHDGSPVSAQVVVDILQDSLRRFAGPVYEDVAGIEATSNTSIDIRLKRPSQFILEALEIEVPKPGTTDIGTGPFMSAGAGRSTMLANPHYYRGAPFISQIDVKEYPSTRTAWAEMLRDNLDMVFEVGVDAVDSLQAASAVNLFWAVRRYQYVILLNSKVSALRPSAVRRALNAAIDRPALVAEAMGGHGVASSGPIWPHHWAAQSNLTALAYDPQSSARAIKSLNPIRFTCLVGPDAVRIALVAKRQLEAVGVEMVVQEASRDDINRAAAQGNFDAILADIISGPSIFRASRWWHSDGTLNRTHFSDAHVDAALDEVRRAISDDEYRTGVQEFQRAVLLNPPAVFLAWDERARAVSKRFDVVAQPGVDIIRTLHLWRPVAGAGKPDNN